MATVPERLVALETRLEAVEAQLRGNGVWLRWLITSLIGAVAAFGAVLAAEIARH